MRKIEPFTLRDFAEFSQKNYADMLNIGLEQGQHESGEQAAESAHGDGVYSELEAQSVHSGNAGGVAAKGDPSHDYSRLGNLSKAQRGFVLKDLDVALDSSYGEEQAEVKDANEQVVAKPNISPEAAGLGAGIAAAIDNKSEEVEADQGRQDSDDVQEQQHFHDERLVDNDSAQQPQDGDALNGVQAILHNFTAAVNALDDCWVQREAQAFCVDIIRSILDQLSHQLVNYIPDEVLWHIISDALPGLGRGLEVNLQVGALSYLFITQKIEDLGYVIQEKGLNFTSYVKNNPMHPPIMPAAEVALPPSEVSPLLSEHGNSENIVEDAGEQLGFLHQDLGSGFLEQYAEKLEITAQNKGIKKNKSENNNIEDKNGANSNKNRLLQKFPRVLKLELDERLEAVDVNIKVNKDKFSFQKERFLQKVEDLLVETLLGA